LQRAGRELVRSPNHIRCRRPQEIKRVVRKKVGIGEPDHPFYGRHLVRSAQGDVLTDRTTGERVEQFVEADVTVTERIAPWYPTALQSVVQLPPIDPNAQHPIWRGNAKPDV